MKTKILLGTALFLALILISARITFNRNFNHFKTTIQDYERNQLTIFDKEKTIQLDKFTKDSLDELFNLYYDESKYIIVKDTAYSFFFQTGKVKYKIGKIDYFECLRKKCIIEKQNEITQAFVASREQELEMKFGNSFTLWYPKFKDEKLLKEKLQVDACPNYYPDLSELSYNIDAWIEFETFLHTYDAKLKLAEIQNLQTESQYFNNVTAAQKKLNSGVHTYFNNQLEYSENQILKTDNETNYYNSTELGLITYKVPKKTFDKQAFQAVIDDAFEEQWKYNSLITGSMPYSSCYGSSNHCNEYGCSQIKVKTGGSGDVLVTIKNYNGKVVRHAYIEGGDSFTFHVTDGSYQVFFYSGTGWNPNKKITSPSCGYLQGGFLSNESVTKDSYIRLDNQIMSYELILQEQGNFNTQPSSKAEAF